MLNDKLENVIHSRFKFRLLHGGTAGADTATRDFSLQKAWALPFGVNSASGSSHLYYYNRFSFLLRKLRKKSMCWGSFLRARFPHRAMLSTQR